MDVCKYYIKAGDAKMVGMVNGSFIKGKRPANQGFFDVFFFTSLSQISISSELETTVSVPHSPNGSILVKGWAKKWFSGGFFVFVKRPIGINKSAKFSEWKHVFLVDGFQFLLYRFQYMRIKQVVDTQLDI